MQQLYSQRRYRESPDIKSLGYAICSSAKDCRCSNPTVNSNVEKALTSGLSSV